MANSFKSRILLCLNLLSCLCYAVSLLGSSVFISRAVAQEAEIPIIRDAEIESLISDYAKPILRAAKQRTDIEVVLVNDDSFNAFVDGARIFINTGALLQAKTPNEIIGVLAHETGHLAGGHQYAIRDRLKQARTIAVAGLLLGLGTSIAGGGAAGAGIMAGGQDIAMRNFLSYQRSEESLADQYAVKYLNATGQSAKGMLETFQSFSRQVALEGERPDPYLQSHPLPQARISAIAEMAKKSPYYNKKGSPELQLQHDLARAKLAAYQDKPSVLRSLSKDPGSLPARYGRAILALEKGLPDQAVSQAQALIKTVPSNPYFRELLGDAYMKAGQLNQAAAAYKQAIALDSHKSPQLYISYGRALLAEGSAAGRTGAIAALQAALRKESDDPDAYNFLAMAYGQSGKTALADLALADSHYYGGDMSGSRFFALRAQQGLKQGSAQWLRAQDILNAAKKASGRGSRQNFLE